MEDIKKLLVYFRNALAFSYSWLVLCTVLVSLAGGNSEVTVLFLLKLLTLCAWGSFCFVFSFCTRFMRKRGFVADLTVFFLLFVPAEVLMFYLMGIFEGTGTPALWITLAVIVAVFYVSALCIDIFVMRRRSKEYTEKLMDYNAHNASK
ncbi:MAG: hypothetical protein IKG30_06300 [Clostridiales bacterium]|nr:hypothetical protein [Clostridiales bacterium]